MRGGVLFLAARRGKGRGDGRFGKLCRFMVGRISKLLWPKDFAHMRSTPAAIGLGCQEIRCFGKVP